MDKKHLYESLMLSGLFTKEAIKYIVKYEMAWYRDSRIAVDTIDILKSWVITKDLQDMDYYHRHILSDGSSLIAIET